MLNRRRGKRGEGFHHYVVHDLLGDTPGITSRAMFGGWGIYKDGMMVAIIVDGELFVKADGASQRIFEACGSRQCTYTTRIRTTPVAMPYWLVPDGVMEDRETFHDWMARAAQTASAQRHQRTRGPTVKARVLGPQRSRISD